MKETSSAHVTNKSLAKGLIAGLVAGLVGTAAKTLAERMFPPRAQGEPEPLAAKTPASEPIHWAFGAATGAAYGALAEFYPAATSKEGASFGLALGTLTHEGALPALGLSAEPSDSEDSQDQTLRERASEMSSHVVFGVVTETVRRLLRGLL